MKALVLCALAALCVSVSSARADCGRETTVVVSTITHGDKVTFVAEASGHCDALRAMIEVQMAIQDEMVRVAELRIQNPTPPTRSPEEPCVLLDKPVLMVCGQEWLPLPRPRPKAAPQRPTPATPPKPKWTPSVFGDVAFDPS